MDSSGHKSSLLKRLGEPHERIGLWGWLLLYSTGASLLFFLLAHIWLIHYVSNQPISLESVRLTLRSPLVRVINLGLLAFSLIHGMAGLRRIILDMDLLKKGGSQILSWLLFISATIFFGWGLLIFNRLSS